MKTNNGMNSEIFLRARKCLERWAKFAERYWWSAPDRADLGCFGTGYNSWGVQTNQKYLGACAVLLADPARRQEPDGLKHEALQDRVLKALRFSMESHVTGSYHCTDGTQWGLTGISPLGIERMMHGVDSISGLLTEQEKNDGGGFLSRRLAHMAARNAHYFGRLESDKAVVLSMAVEWNRRRPFDLKQDPLEASVEGGWEEPRQGAVFHRSRTRLASWCWRSCMKESPQGLCLPPDDGHLAEWEMNLAGAVIPAAESSIPVKREDRLVRHEQWMFDGGFLTCGEVIDGANVYIGEGWKAPETARHQIVFAAVPQTVTVGPDVPEKTATDLANRSAVKSQHGRFELELPPSSARLFAL